MNVRGGAGKVGTVDVPLPAPARSPAGRGSFFCPHSSHLILCADLGPGGDPLGGGGQAPADRTPGQLHGSGEKAFSDGPIERTFRGEPAHSQDLFGAQDTVGEVVGSDGVDGVCGCGGRGVDLLHGGHLHQPAIFQWQVCPSRSGVNPSQCPCRHTELRIEAGLMPAICAWVAVETIAGVSGGASSAMAARVRLRRFSSSSGAGVGRGSFGMARLLANKRLRRASVIPAGNSWLSNSLTLGADAGYKGVA